MLRLFLIAIALALASTAYGEVLIVSLGEPTLAPARSHCGPACAGCNNWCEHADCDCPRREVKSVLVPNVHTDIGIGAGTSTPRVATHPVSTKQPAKKAATTRVCNQYGQCYEVPQGKRGLFGRIIGR